MAKTSASVILAVLVVTLFLKGCNAGNVERGYQPEKGEADAYNSNELVDFFECLKLFKLCYDNPPKYCSEYYDKCRDLQTTVAKSDNHIAEILIP
ncbi:unnamed protein product [Vicia faba]|uniref:Uncharacterized protein n=1 Tax=Vicia faba TaxID=3906 RepID=A0AAV0ZRZ6_VICFA|nr:unnamed protein product [Vicia faba]